MKDRFQLLLKAFVTFLLYFFLQKCVFMAYNAFFTAGHSVSDALRVIMYGFSLDAATVGYLIAVPWLVSLLSLSFGRVPVRKILMYYYVPVGLLLGTITVVDFSLYPFWHFKLDASVFQYLDSPAGAAASVSVWFIVVRLLLILLFSAILIVALYRITPRYWDKVSGLKRRMLATVSLLAIAGPLFLMIRGGVGESTTNIGQAYFSTDELLNHSAVNPAFSLLASISKNKDYAGEFNFFDEERRKVLFDGLYPTDDIDTPSLLTTQRPNVLIILMESFGGTLSGNAQIAPNLNRLKREGIWFEQSYSNSWRTDRGMVCTFSGYQSFPNLSVMKIPAKSRTLPSIASELREVGGYGTAFLYGGDINFTNMKSYLKESGYETLKADVDFPLSSRKNPWGVNDDITFDDLYTSLLNRPSPWFQSFLTLSSHEPFEVPYKRLSEKIPNAFAFTDHNLGRFVDKLKKTSLWKNLLIICLPDHGFPYPDSIPAHDPRIHHSPILWLGGAIRKPMVVDKLMNQSDLAATLLAQLGMSHRKFNFSRNVLSHSYRYPFAYYTFNNGFAFIDSTGYTVFDNNSMRPIHENPSPSQQRTDLGKAILQTSYDDLGGR